MNIDVHKCINIFRVPNDITTMIVCGDIHGEYRTLMNKIISQYSLTDTCVIVAGDCGFGFFKYGYYEKELNYVSKKLKEKNIYILFVRGNHDSPEYFRRDDFFRTDRVFCVPDYSLISWNSHNILCVGGAISIDRWPRMLDNFKLKEKKYSGDERYRPLCYWEGEMPSFDIIVLDQVLEVAKPDIVVTHCAPEGVTPVRKLSMEQWAEHDEYLIDSIEVARRRMKSLYTALTLCEKCDIRNWFYGHYHFSNTEYIENTKFQLLNILEFVEIR